MCGYNAGDMFQTLVYTKLARIEDAVQMLKAVISADTPDHVSAGSEVFQDIVSMNCNMCEPCSSNCNNS